MDFDIPIKRGLNELFCNWNLESFDKILVLISLDFVSLGYHGCPFHCLQVFDIKEQFFEDHRINLLDYLTKIL